MNRWEAMTDYRTGVDLTEMPLCSLINNTLHLVLSNNYTVKHGYLFIQYNVVSMFNLLAPKTTYFFSELYVLARQV